MPQKILLKIYRYALMLKADGKTFSEIKQALVDRGIDEKSAGIVADNIDKNYTEIRAASRRKSILHGSIWLGAGLALILAAYFMNLHNSEYPYFVGSCAVIFGIIRFAGAFVK